jgi:hypothetical protein
MELSASMHHHQQTVSFFGATLKSLWIVARAACTTELVR